MYKQTWRLITESQHIVLISHINPDGDALGSSLALYPLLKDMGKTVSIVNVTTPLPIRYDFLPNFTKIKQSMPLKFDLIISFDCGSYDRLGIKKHHCPLINIDHHKTNTNYGDINLIDSTKASASSVVLKLLEQNDIALRRDVATCIYTALAEDTGFFSFENVNATVFEDAAKLIAAKANPGFIAQQLKERNSLAKIRLTGIVINQLELINDAKIAYAILTLEDFKKSGALRSDSDECVDLIRSIVTVELAILLIEESDGYKISLRSKAQIDVSDIALAYGGGGHKRAAGFTAKTKETNTIIQNILNEATI